MLSVRLSYTAPVTANIVAARGKGRVNVGDDDMAHMPVTQLRGRQALGVRITLLLQLSAHFVQLFPEGALVGRRSGHNLFILCSLRMDHIKRAFRTLGSLGGRWGVMAEVVFAGFRGNAADKLVRQLEGMQLLRRLLVILRVQLTDGGFHAFVQETTCVYREPIA